MTKDEQIKFLADALRSIRDDHAPWHGEDAVNMMNEAHDALVEWANMVNRPDAIRCKFNKPEKLKFESIEDENGFI